MALPKKDTKKPTSGSNIGKTHNNTTVHNVVKDFQDTFQISTDEYFKQINNDTRLKLIDLFCFFLVVLGIVQFSFICLIRDNYPFNAFLAGFIICVGQFVLLISFRLQMVSPHENISINKAMGEFIMSSLILHFICLHFVN